jgi:hypothetical protein
MVVAMAHVVQRNFRRLAVVLGLEGVSVDQGAFMGPLFYRATQILNQ